MSDLHLSPTEELMREHGIVRRILLIFDEASLRLFAGSPVAKKPLFRCLQILQTIIEDFHEETLEEEYLFPLAERDPNQKSLLTILEAQHKEGQAMTRTLHYMLRKDIHPLSLAEELHRFTRLYHAHATIEDTSLFPVARKMASSQEWLDLGRIFHELKKKEFGLHSFFELSAEMSALDRAFERPTLEELSAELGIEQ